MSCSGDPLPVLDCLNTLAEGHADHAETVFLRDLKQGEPYAITNAKTVDVKEGQRIVLTLNNTIAVFLPARFGTMDPDMFKDKYLTYFGKEQRGKISIHKLRFSITAVGPLLLSFLCQCMLTMCVCVTRAVGFEHTTRAALNSFQHPHVLFLIFFFFSTFPCF